MRDKGTFNFSGNLEVKKDAPLEARSLVNSYADLTKPETWTDEEGGVWTYSFMNVTCKDRPGKIYQLIGEDYTEESNWKEIGSSSGSGIEDAPADNKIYGRKNNDWTEVISSGGDSGTFVLETAAADSLTDTEYNDLKDAIEANKIIIADLGLTLGVIAQIYQPCFAATYDSGSNRIVLSLTQTTGTVSSSEDTRRLVVCDIIISGSADHTVSRDNYNLVNENQVLTFGQTKEYTPTTVYSPATKKYVDEHDIQIWGIVPNLTLNNLTEQQKEKLIEIAESNKNLALTYYLSYEDNGNYIEEEYDAFATRYFYCQPGGSPEYYYTGIVFNGLTIVATLSLYLMIEDGVIYAFSNSVDLTRRKLVTSDNLTTITKKTAAEYEAIGSKDANTAYCVTD